MVLVLTLVALPACGGRTVVSGADAGDGGSCHVAGAAVVPDSGKCSEVIRCSSDPYDVQYLIDCSCATSTCTCTRAGPTTDTVYATIPTTHCGCDSNDLVEPEIVAACGIGP